MSRSEIIDAFCDRIQQGNRQRLSKEDLEGLIQGFIELLQGADSEAEIKTLCEAEIRLLEKGYPQTTLATKYLSKYRKAIEAVIADGTLKQTAGNSHQYTHRQRMTGLQENRTEHWALTHLKYAPEVYEALDKRQSTVNRSKQLSLKLVQVDRYLQTLQSLFTKSGKFEARRLAIAIAGLTGRRIGEVVARGSFQMTDHPYMLHFEGQQKKEREGYSIVTLIPAAAVLEQIQRFRQLPDIQQLGEMTGDALRAAINQFDVQANRVCDRRLGQSGVVPPLEGKKTVTVHNLRSLWGAVAAYFFCPEHHHEYAFLQHYLGHVLDSGATGNYFRYQLTDAQGRLLREKGVLLAQVGALPLMEEEMKVENGDAATPQPLPLLDLLHASEAMEQVKPYRLKAKTPGRAIASSSGAVTPPESTAHQASAAAAVSQEDLVQLQTTWRAELEQTVATLRSDFEAQLQAVRIETNGGWFVRRVEGLERDNLSLRRERDQAIAQAEGSQGYGEKIEQLQTENAILTQKLKLAQDKLDGFRLLLNGTESTEPEEAGNASETTTLQSEQSDSAITPIAERTEPMMPTQRAIPQPDATLPKVRGPKAGKAFQRAEAIFLAIKEWNRLYPSESFVINAGVLETVFRVHRQAVKEFCNAYQNELWDYHQEIGVESPRWHNRGKDTEMLKVFVAQRMQG